MRIFSNVSHNTPEDSLPIPITAVSGEHVKCYNTFGGLGLKRAFEIPTTFSIVKPLFWWFSSNLSAFISGYDGFHPFVRLDRICMHMLPLGNAARATRTVSSGMGARGDARRDIAHLLDRHGDRAQTTRFTSLFYIQCTRLCPRLAPIGRLWEFASRVSVGIGPPSRTIGCLRTGA